MTTIRDLMPSFNIADLQKGVEDMWRYNIRHMKRRDRFYKVLKEELMALGHWKNKPRGNPSKGYQAMKSKST